MRARSREVAAGAGAEWAIAQGLVGMGEALEQSPETVLDAVQALERTNEKAGRMLWRFAGLPSGTFVWTRERDGSYRLGRIAGGWRYEDSAEARAVGICQVRPAEWAARAFGEDEVPAAVSETFARGGRNLQRIADGDAERATAQLWRDSTPQR